MASLNIAYAAVLTVTDGDAGIVSAGAGLYYKDFAVPPGTVKPGSTMAQLLGVAESRIPTIPEPSLTLEHRGAFVVLQSATVLRLYWRGLLATDVEAGAEALSASVRLVDLDDVADELLELKYQLQRVLGILGENMVQDLIARDTVGNMTSYRLRVFNSKVNAEASTPDIEDGEPLETGELSRITRTVSIDIAKNDRDLLIGVLTDIAATPGVS